MPDLIGALTRQPRLPRFLCHLYQRLQQERLNLVTGAGISIDAKVPSWSDLLDRLAESFPNLKADLVEHRKTGLSLEYLGQIIYHRHRRPQVSGTVSSLKEAEIKHGWAQLIHAAIYKTVGGSAATTTFSASGNVGLGTTNPYSRLQVTGPDSAASTTAFLVANSASSTEFYVSDNGNAVLAGGLTQNSDQRLKTNVTTLDASSSLVEIEALNPVSFDWINNLFGGGQQLGFIAQQVQQQFPQLVSTTSPTALTPGGTLGLNYSGLIAPIVAAIQEIANEIASLETTIAGFATSFTSARGTFTNELCVGSTCVTPAQFEAMAVAAGEGGAAQSSSG
jgi:hypothetical protein